jgi:hypothetical protein
MKSDHQNRNSCGPTLISQNSLSILISQDQWFCLTAVNPPISPFVAEKMRGDQKVFLRRVDFELSGLVEEGKH